MTDIRLTEIHLSTVQIGGTEREAQAVIDALQARGWNVVWGTGPSSFVDMREEAAFGDDLTQALKKHVNGSI